MENKFIDNSAQIDQEKTTIQVDSNRNLIKFDHQKPQFAPNTSVASDVSMDIDSDVIVTSYPQTNDCNRGDHLKLSKSLSSDIIPFDDDETDELALTLNVNDEPITFKEAITCPQSHDWQEAMQAEINELEKQNTWTLLPLPHDKIPLKGRWIYKLKTDPEGKIIKFKARWVVKGYNQIEGVDYLDTFSSTCRPESYRIIFILAVNQGWRLSQYDVKNAFIHAKIDKEIFVEQPRGFTAKEDSPEKKLYCRLNKALYGLKQSPRLWYEHLLGILENYDFKAMPYDSAIFINSAEKIIIVCHVDDLIITGPDQSVIDTLINSLSRSIKLEKIGNINQFLGMRVETNYKNKTIHLNQHKYAKKLLEKFNKNNLTPVTSPVELRINLEKSLDQASAENIHRYQQEVGSLIYLAMNTRPDITFAVNRCARFMANPNDSHFKALDRIWKYLNKYPELGLFYDCSQTNGSVLGYTDADWGGDTTSRKSTSGYIFLLNNNMISWLSMLQKTVALSSCEAEYMALKESIKESIYLNNMIKYYYDLLGVLISSSIPNIMTDSQSAMKLANNPEFHKKTKHIDITYHFIRDAIKQKQIVLEYVNTKQQKADGFTKGLDTLKHKSFLQTLNLK